MRSSRTHRCVHADWGLVMGVASRRGHPSCRAVLFDRDGTLIADVPYNNDPEKVVPQPGAQGALERLRDRGLKTGVVSNQSAIGLGRATSQEVGAVNRRVDQLLGPFDVWRICPHDHRARCRCRKPAPGLIVDAAAVLGIPTQRCAVVGDIGTDMVAATAAGAWPILVPTPATRPEEMAQADFVVNDLAGAVDLVLGAA